MAKNFVAGSAGAVFGGQLLAQTIVAGATVDPTKDVRSVHTIFARGGSPTSRSISRWSRCTLGGPWAAPR